MKKALDYVSDYKLKSACKDAICTAPSKVTQMIFAFLEDWYHHIVFAHSCKLISFHIYICRLIAKSHGMSLTHVKSTIAEFVSLPFTFLMQSSIPPVGYRTLDVSTTAAAPTTTAAHYTWKSGFAVVDFDWRHLIAKPSTRTSVRCKDLDDICCISPFCLKFCCHGNKGRSGKIQLAAFDGPFPKTPT